MSLVGNEIKKYRKELGLSQKELGKRLDVSQAMIAQYENGNRLPKLSTMVKLASALNIDAHILTDAYQQDIRTNIDLSNDTIQLATPSQSALRALVRDIISDTSSDIFSQFNTDTPEGRKAVRTEIMKLLAAHGEISVLYFDDTEYTKEELSKIKDFAEFLKNQRKK